MLESKKMRMTMSRNNNLNNLIYEDSLKTFLTLKKIMNDK